MSSSLWPHGLQHDRLPCPSPTPRVYSNSCALSQCCHPTISSSVIPFSFLQFSPASRSFPMSQFFASSGQSIGASASASILPMNIQHSFPLGLTGGRFMLMYGKTNTISWSKNNFKKSLLQHHNSKASILQHSVLFMVQPFSAHIRTENKCYITSRF